jgi:hypothetical protein
MKAIIVGGNFGNPKSSKVVAEIARYISNTTDLTILNGGELESLPRALDYDLSIWMPNINNEEKKHYPIKKKGSVLICSKVMRKGYSNVDAVSRIFKMRGNAVIAIYTDKKPFTFKLIDALGNEWYNGSSIEDLVKHIISFYIWTKQAIRIDSIPDNSLNKEEHYHLKELLILNNKLADFVQKQCGDRFFGNISTRCQKLFPTASNKFGIYVSPRNVNKELLTVEDMVYMTSDMHYKGNFKPSVDAPCQITIYNSHPEIHYMIHGHAFIKGAPTTKEYYLCGDVREAHEVSFIIKGSGVINLKNHGFLIYSETIEKLQTIVNKLIENREFSYER